MQTNVAHFVVLNSKATYCTRYSPELSVNFAGFFILTHSKTVLKLLTNFGCLFICTLVHYIVDSFLDDQEQTLQL